jgi:hypothetical protein
MSWLHGCHVEADTRLHLLSPGRYAANQTASLGASQAVADVRHRLTLQPQDGHFVLYVEAAVSLFALALQVCAG